MNKQIILIASFFGLTAVILGAFGAHGLEGKISDYHLDTWKTANQYHFYHTFALLFLSTFSRAKMPLYEFLLLLLLSVSSCSRGRFIC